MKAILCLALLLAAPAAVSAAETARAHLGYFDPARPMDQGGPERRVPISFPLILRIGLEEKQDSTTLTCPKAYRITHGQQAIAAAAGDRWTFRIKEGQPAEIEYSIAVKTLEWAQVGEARDEVTAWRGRGWPQAGLVEAGALLLAGERPIHDSRRRFVAVARTTDAAAVEPLQQKLRAAGERPFVIEKLLRLPEGIIEATGPAGAAVVSRGPFEITCDDRVKVFQVEHDVGYPWHGREDREYAGSILVMVDRWGKLVVINRLEMEQYLKGVVPCEIEGNAPIEAQKVQAVSARGETVAGYGVRHPADPYDFEASQKDQQYAGLTRQTPLATRAVLETRGQVLKAGVKIVETVYAANCGGHTEDNEAVWTSPVDPQLRAVPDSAPGIVPSPVTEASLGAYLRSYPNAWCKDANPGPNNKFRWQVTRTAAEVDKLVAAAGHKVGRVRELVPLSRGRSGRLRSLKVVGDQGQVKVDKELPIRQLLGGLRSGLFIVEPGEEQGGRPGSFTFVGGGWGHGVGMCQMGARGMAVAGKPCLEILTHYFSGSELARLYD